MKKEKEKQQKTKKTTQMGYPVFGSCVGESEHQLAISEI